MILRNSLKMVDGQHGILMMNNNNKYYKMVIHNLVDLIQNFNLHHHHKEIVRIHKVILIRNRMMMIVNKINKILVNKD